MINLIKKIFFSFYLFLTKFQSKALRSISFKIGQWFVKPMGTAIYKYKGCKYRLSPLNIIDKAIIFGLGHDSLVEEQILSQLSNGGVFIDIGANFGYFSILAAKMKNVDVLAFEPSLKELMKLYDHMILNKTHNLHVFPVGLADKLCLQKLFLGPDRNTGTNSVLKDSNHGYITTIFTPISNVAPLDFFRRARICKIDVEGYEVFVLEGMKEIMQHLENCNFVVEITPSQLIESNHTPKDIYDFFGKFGYVGKFGLRTDNQYDEIFYRK